MNERSALEKMTEREKQKVELLRRRFLEWLEAIQFSPKTRVNYAREVKLFLEWLSDNTDVAGVAEVTPQHLQQYQIALYQQSQSEEDGEVKRLAVGTQAAKLAAVKKFCEWLLAEQQIAHNPAGMLQSPRPGQSPYKGLPVIALQAVDLVAKVGAERTIPQWPRKKIKRRKPGRY